MKDRQTAKQTTRVGNPLRPWEHNFEILRRDGSGAGELHQNWTAVFVVQGGEATILYGWPPGGPHHTVVEPGKLFFVLIVKVERKL